MSRGGNRPGAGRKRGARNKITAEIQAEAAASGEMPRDYMLRIMRDTSIDNHRRDDMAKAAAPFYHAKLAGVTHSGPDGGPIKTADVSDIEIARRIAFALAEADQKVRI